MSDLPSTTDNRPERPEGWEVSNAAGQALRLRLLGIQCEYGRE